MADEKETPKLSALLDGKFKMAQGFAPGRYTKSGISIDTRKCNEIQAKAFIALGSKVLVEIATKEEKTPDADKKKA